MNNLIVEIAIAAIDAFVINGNRSAVVGQIDALAASGITPEEFPAAIRGIRIKQDSDTQAAIDKARQGPIPE